MKNSGQVHYGVDVFVQDWPYSMALRSEVLKRERKRRE
jgi:hypothetical protein